MKVTVKEATQANEVVAEQYSNVITDGRGRQIVIRELDPMEESRLIFAIGSERSQNVVYVQAYAIPAACAAEIDGEAYSVPQNIQQLEGRMKILGREGMNAIAAHLYKSVADDTGDAAAEKEATKN
ncbi:hypothetical protein G9451_04115 [Enterobacter kobei]|uniref:hypothetical protein n=1 Tax=Enterobacter kobei TaxID=208224 RepID=UPI001882EC09|nr:hypothetical protein [Enterobacter kobei]MBE8915090.1 hypothetical protein [Enterobacter kobei]